AATLDKPCASVPSLHAVALSTFATGAVDAVDGSRWTVPLLRAGRGEVFVQSLIIREGNIVTELSSPLHLPLSRVLEQLALKEHSILFAGPAAIQMAEQIESFARTKSIDFFREKDSQSFGQSISWVLAEAMRGNLSDYVAKIAHQIYLEQAHVAAEGIQAIYVRPSDPELKDRFIAGKKDDRKL
ncbi:MAG: hypothetical protein ACRD63_03905, partial [Pyrinomonadaceae bacterium]